MSGLGEAADGRSTTESVAESSMLMRRSGVVGPVGFEPTTYGLRVRCSTN
jgi:hypothetical protein